MGNISSTATTTPISTSKRTDISSTSSIKIAPLTPKIDSTPPKPGENWATTYYNWMDKRREEYINKNPSVQEYLRNNPNMGLQETGSFSGSFRYVPKLPHEYYIRSGKIDPYYRPPLDNPNTTIKRPLIKGSTSTDISTQRMTSALPPTFGNPTAVTVPTKTGGISLMRTGTISPGFTGASNAMKMPSTIGNPYKTSMSSNTYGMISLGKTAPKLKTKW
jgi:hypothetical protein